jgi:hypothetical protein
MDDTNTDEVPVHGAYEPLRDFAGSYRGEQNIDIQMGTSSAPSHSTHD